MPPSYATIFDNNDLKEDEDKKKKWKKNIAV